MRSRWLLCAILIVVTIAPLAAERAVLQVGPESDRGLIFLPVNVLEYHRGEYSIGDARLLVLHTRGEIPVYDDWSEFGCDEISLLRVSELDGREILYLIGDDEWHLFVEVPTGFEATCEFVSEFVRRFRYFLEVGDSDGPPPFPAILALD